MTAAKKTVDHGPNVDVYQVPPSKGELPENRYYFQLPAKDGAPVDLSVPLMEFLPGLASDFMEEQARERTLSEWGFSRGLFKLLDPEHAELYSLLANDQISALTDDWVTKSSVTVGESQASEGS